jgi:hypothetical protein
VTVVATGNLEVTLDFSSLGRAFIHVMNGSGDPISNEDVQATFVVATATGPLGRYQATTTLSLDADGTQYFDRLPPGDFVAVVKRSSGDIGLGTGFATTFPDDLFFASVVVGAGDVVELGPSATVGLGGGDGYLYFIDGSGETSGEGRLNDEGVLVEQSAFHDALSLKVANETLCCAPAATLSEDNGDRTLTLTPFASTTRPGLTVTRQVFTPAQGGFARYVDTFTNTTASPMAVPVQLITLPDQSSSMWWDVSPSQTDGGFVVRVDPNEQAASFGIVFAGVDPPAAPQLTYPDTFDYFLSTATLMLAPGQRLALMNFVILRGPTSQDDVFAQIDGLQRLTDPSALSGLSAEARATIVNFRIQP